MPSPRYSSSPQAQASGPIMAEGATLPRLRAAGFEARVNAYVVGRTERMQRHSAVTSHGQSSNAGPSPLTYPSAYHAPASPPSPGCANGVTDLWYLSLVAPRGQGTTLRALWANLVSNRERSVWLEGVGSVALGHHRLDLTTLGYPIHWTYRQALIPPSRDVQSVLEADTLTCYDPLLAPPPSPRRQRASNQPTRHRRNTATTERATGGALILSSRSDQGSSGAGGGDSATEVAARETRPLFLLLTRVAESEASSNTAPYALSAPTGEEDQAPVQPWIARLHLRFLATRIAWLPYYPRWANYLWQRALEQGEAELLTTWSYVTPSVTETAEAPETSSGTTPSASSAALTSAYLCHPDPLALTADLQQAIRAGVFARPVRQRLHEHEHEQSAQAPAVAVADDGARSQPQPLIPAA